MTLRRSRTPVFDPFVGADDGRVPVYDAALHRFTRGPVPADSTADAPGAAPARLVVPYYDYTSFDDVDMTTIIDNPSHGPVVIVNVDTGPGSSPNSDFQHEIARMDAAGVTVVGYVNTSYATVNYSTVTADVDKWYQFYGHGVSGMGTGGIGGVFFDLTPTGATGDLKSYMENAAAYVHAQGTAQTVVFNPGTYPLEVDGYVDPADIVCVWEADYDGGAYLSMEIPAWAADWVAGVPRSKMLHLVYNVTTATDMRLAMDHAVSKGARCFYSTSGGSSWTTLDVSYAAQAAYANSKAVLLDPTDRREHHGPIAVTSVADASHYKATSVGTSTYTPNMQVALVHQINLTGSATVAAPTNGYAGQHLTLIFVQSSGTTNTATLDSVFKVAGGSFTASTGSSAKSSVSFVSDGTSWIEVGRALAVA